MTTSMMMYPAFQPMQQYELPYQQHNHFYTAAAAPTNTMPSYMQMLANTHTQHAAQQSTASSVVPEELRCQYSSKRCENRRTHKKSGGLHKFCAVHREKANRNQMRLDHRRRVLKRLAQRTGDAAPSSPSSVSTASASLASSSRSSPYAKKRSAASSKSPHNNNSIDSNVDSKNGIWSVEDDLDVDLMPLALHRENNPVSTHAQQESMLLDAQDLHILETLLFSDDDKATTASILQPRTVPATAPTIKTEKSIDETKGWHLDL